MRELKFSNADKIVTFHYERKLHKGETLAVFETLFLDNVVLVKDVNNDEDFQDFYIIVNRDHVSKLNTIAEEYAYDDAIQYITDTLEDYEGKLFYELKEEEQEFLLNHSDFYLTSDDMMDISEYEGECIIDLPNSYLSVAGKRVCEDGEYTLIPDKNAKIYKSVPFESVVE